MLEFCTLIKDTLKNNNNKKQRSKHCINIWGYFKDIASQKEKEIF
ncbi:MAG: DUF1722 domain-containing protein [Thermovenabulum sp.]